MSMMGMGTYDIITAMRGPDNNYSAGAGEAKALFSGVLRWYMKVNPNGHGTVTSVETAKRFMRFGDALPFLRANNHYWTHAKKGMAAMKKRLTSQYKRGRISLAELREFEEYYTALNKAGLV